MTNVEVATMEDLEGICDLESRVFSEIWHKTSIENSIAKDDITVLVAQDLGKVVGYMIYYHIVDEGEIMRVAVDPAYRRKGIARSILNTMIERGPEESLIDYSLEVRESNEAAIALYHSFDFTIEGKRRAYYRNPTEDGLIMWRWGDRQEG